MKTATGSRRASKRATTVALAVLAGFLAGSLLALPPTACCPAVPGPQTVSLALADCCNGPAAGACSGEIRRAAPPVPSVPTASSAPPTVLGESIAAPTRTTFICAAALASRPASLAGFAGFTHPLLV